MADTPTAAPPSSPSSSPRMSIQGSTAVAAGGGVSSAALVVFFWNWLAVRDWNAPQIDAVTAANLALLLASVCSALEVLLRWAVGWLPMPPTRNRRG